MKRKIRAISFDVGGTLIKPWPSVGHVYAEVAAEYGWPGLSPEKLNEQFGLAWRRLKNFSHTRVEWAGLVNTTFRGVIAAPPSRAFFSALYQRFADADAWNIFDDVLPALEALAERGLKLAVTSNWDRRLIPLLRTLELDAKGESDAYGKVFAKVPMVGFSTYGEEYIGHINQTATMVLFR